MTDEEWHSQAFGGLPPEYREALLPMAEQTDIVVIPLAGTSPPPEPVASGWRGSAIKLARRMLACLQSTAPQPSAINSGPRHLLADTLYEVITWLAGRQARDAWRDHTSGLVERVRAAAARDPGRRLLVVLNVRHCHHVRKALRRDRDLQVVPYEQL